MRRARTLVQTQELRGAGVGATGWVGGECVSRSGGKTTAQWRRSHGQGDQVGQKHPVPVCGPGRGDHDVARERRACCGGRISRGRRDAPADAPATAHSPPCCAPARADEGREPDDKPPHLGVVPHVQAGIGPGVENSKSGRRAQRRHRTPRQPQPAQQHGLGGRHDKGHAVRVCVCVWRVRRQKGRKAGGGGGWGGGRDARGNARKRSPHTTRAGSTQQSSARQTNAPALQG